MKTIKNTFKILSLTAVLVCIFHAGKALAAPLTSKSDSMSRLGNSTTEDVYSDHTIQFVTPTGITSGQTIVITFPSGFNGTTHPNGALDFSDVNIFVNAVPDGTCGGTQQTVVSTSPTASQWSAVFSGADNTVLTLTSGGATAVAGANNEVCIKIGQNTTTGTTASQYLNPAASGSYTISIAAGDDSGDIVTRIIDNDRVTITAHVTETITFSLSDYEVGFGNLNPTGARFATGTEPYGANGPTPVVAHTMSVSTNGSSGYEITYIGNTLTSGAGDTIDAATITGDEDGTPGTEQFAIGFVAGTDATVVPAYNQANPTFNYSFVPNVETPFVYETAPSDTEIVSAYYLANISGVTPAGLYSTSLTYVATANF